MLLNSDNRNELRQVYRQFKCLRLLRQCAEYSTTKICPGEFWGELSATDPLGCQRTVTQFNLHPTISNSTSGAWNNNRWSRDATLGWEAFKVLSSLSGSYCHLSDCQWRAFDIAVGILALPSCSDSSNLAGLKRPKLRKGVILWPKCPGRNRCIWVMAFRLTIFSRSLHLWIFTHCIIFVLLISNCILLLFPENLTGKPHEQLGSHHMGLDYFSLQLGNCMRDTVDF